MTRRAREDQDPRFVYDATGLQTGLNWDRLRPPEADVVDLEKRRKPKG